MNKKSNFIFAMLLAICSMVYGQEGDVKLFLNDGTIVEGNFKGKGKNLVSTTTKEKYHIDDIKEMITYYENKTDSIHFYILDTKTYTTSKKSAKVVAQKIVGNSKEPLELYYAYSNATRMHSNGTMSFSNSQDAYVKKPNEEYAYAMSYIYGAGYKGIKKRVRAYFTDCPELVAMVKENQLDKNDTKAIVDYYNTSCGK